MAESLVERILAGFKTDLEAIEADGGTTYWNTFDKVARCDVFDRNLLVPQADTFALIRDTGDDRPNDADSAFGEESRELDVWIQVHTRDTRSEKDAHRASTLAGTLRNRLIQDVATKIMSDLKRGGLAIATDHDAELRDLAAPDGWIGAELLYTVAYYHDLGSP
jgi:hypothetical protein